MSGPHVTEATEATFQEEVIERSRAVPVLVDFWAAWCGPCRMLGPALEAEVAARGGKVHLVKVDVDQNPGLAQAFQVQGIPAVKAFVDGRVADEFVGARDRRGVASFIDGLVPSDEEQALADGRRAAHAGDVARARALLEPLRATPTHGDEATLLLATAEARAGHPEAAEQILADLPEETPVRAEADALRLRLAMQRAAAEAGGLEAARARAAAAPDDPDAQWALAASLHAGGDVAGALEALLGLVERHRGYRGDLPRRAMLAIFDELGPGSDVAREYRRRLQIYL